MGRLVKANERFQWDSKNDPTGGGENARTGLILELLGSKQTLLLTKHLQLSIVPGAEHVSVPKHFQPPAHDCCVGAAPPLTSACALNPKNENPINRTIIFNFIDTPKNILPSSQSKTMCLRRHFIPSTSMNLV